MEVGADEMQLIGEEPEKSVSVKGSTNEVASGYLNTDIMVEILTCLPVSSVLRFRCVCKQWRDILSDPRFLQEHFKQSHKHTSLQEKKLLLFDDARGHNAAGRHGEGPLRAQAFLFDVSRRAHRRLWRASSSGIHDIIGTCNGLLCLKTYRWHVYDNEPMIILANPVTGETLAVAPPLGMHHGMATYGFGFHPDTQKFKLIRFPRNGMFGVCDKIQVYTLGDMSWREVMNPFAGCQISRKIVSLGGAAYWKKEDSGEIISFDFKEEHFTSVELPPPLNVGDTQPCQYTLTEVNGRLCVAISSMKSGIITNLDMWCLEDVAGRRSWSHNYSVSLYMLLWFVQQYYFIHDGYFLLGKWNHIVSAYKIRERHNLSIDAETKGMELKVDDAYFNARHVLTFAYTESFAPLIIYRT